jgi:hypothetical protein
MEAESKIKSISGHIRHYLETRYKLLMLDTADKATSMFSSFVTYVVLAVVMTFVLLFLSVGAALWIGHAYGETSMGFLFVGLFYLLVMLVVYLGRNSLIRNPLQNSCITSMFEDEKD